VKDDGLPGKKRGGYIPRYYVFRGFHLSTCYPWSHSPRVSWFAPGWSAIVCADASRSCPHL